MKTLKKLSLVQLSQNELNRRELNKIVGGENCCACGCHGPSSNVDNANANTAHGYISYGGGGATGSFA